MATTKKPTNRTAINGEDQQVIAGIKQDLQSLSSFPLGGTTFTPTSLVAFIQSRIDAANAVAVAKANWLNAVKTYDAINAQATVVVRELKAMVIATYGSGSQKLADFGFNAVVRTPLTPAQKVERAAKAAATRKARGTMGAKQKKAITGATAAAASPPASPTPAPAPAVTPPAAPAPAPAQPPAPPAPAAAPAAPANASPAPAAPHS